jgi:transcriptional regulator with GAF, ATPase, and Fis domain
VHDEPTTLDGPAATTNAGASVDVEPAGAALLERLRGVARSTDELESYLNTVVHAVQQEVSACDEVGVTLLVEAIPRTAAYTTVRTLEIDSVQYSVGDGPCLDAYRNQRENRVDLAEAMERWPAFASQAAEHGYESLLAMPLVSGVEALGALNLYALRPGAFDDLDTAVVRVAAQRCADTVAAAQEIIGARTLAAQLEQAMGSRAVIEQAKGMLMALRGVSERDAFEILRTESQHRNIKVRDLAERVVTGTLALRAGKTRPRPTPRGEASRGRPADHGTLPSP